MNTRYTKFDATQGEDGYWYLFRITRQLTEIGTALRIDGGYIAGTTSRWAEDFEVFPAKMTRQEAEGTANKRNGH